MTTTTRKSARTAGPALQPPAGIYPTGHAGFSRAWDGAAWTGPVLATPDAPELRLRHGFWRAFRHATVYVVVGGLILGWGFATVGGALQSPWLLAAAAVFGTGGPLVGLALLVRRRLDIHRLHVPSAVLWGIASAVVAVVIAWFVEPLVYDLTHSTTLFYAGAGPIEEGGKLLVPFLLLLFGPRIFRDPRVGIWTVVVCGATFGLIEGIEYLLKVDHISAVSGQTLADTGAEDAVRMLLERSWVELGHVIWTGGAAAIIWLAAHRARRAFTGLGVAAFAIAAALHSINDAVFNQLGRIAPALALVGVLLAVAWMVLGYTLWFRARARQAVAPDVLDALPKRWAPRLSKHARAAAIDPAA